jgi:hypothetical protein
VTPSPIASLRHARRPPPGPLVVERCEFCGVELEPTHGHIVNVESRAIVCACRACHLLFTAPGAAGGKYRAVPDRVVALGGASELPGLWQALQIPVGLAFLFYHSALGRAVALYPSPAGVTESELPLDSWAAIAREVPGLESLEADVEAVVISSTGGSVEAVRAPIDRCYAFVGRVRRTWRGFDGGDAVRREREAFLDELRADALTPEAAREMP